MLSPLPPPSLPPWCVRLSVALCASEHDPLGVSAASLRSQRWQLANGRWLHQQPARQVEVVPPPTPSQQYIILNVHQTPDPQRRGAVD